MAVRLREWILGLVGLSAAMVVLTVSGASASPAPVPVKAHPNPIREFGAAVSQDYFAWQRTSVAHPHTYNLFEQAMTSGSPGGLATRVNAPRSRGYVGGISGTRLAYQQVVGGQSDIRFFDLVTHQRSKPPIGVDSRYWEYNPSITDRWILFGRNRHQASHVLLENLANHSVRALFSIPFNRTGTRFAQPGQVNGDYATFSVRMNATKASVYLYTISTHTLRQLTHPKGLQDFGSAVSSTGTLYFSRTGPKCSSVGNQLVERPLLGGQTTFWILKRGVRAVVSQTYNDGVSDQVFYTRVTCATAAEDVYRIAGL